MEARFLGYRLSTSLTGVSWDISFMSGREDRKDNRAGTVSLESSKRLEDSLEKEDREVAGRGHS